MTRAEHRRFVEQRKQSSAVWQTIHWFGSLHLAMVLLATIAVACAVATFVEAGFTTKIAQAYIYKAPWFSLWLGVLMVNLVAVTVTRWPWQRYHFGFVITHYGIVLLLIGAMIGQKFGFEGSVRLDQGQPRGRIIDREMVIQISTLEGTLMHPFDPEIARPSPMRERTLTLPDGKGRIVIDGVADHLVEEARLVPADTGGGAPGLELRIASTRLNREMRVPLIAGERELFDLGGLAHVRLANGFPAKPEVAPTQPGGDGTIAGNAGSSERIVETWVVMANAPEQPIVTRADAAPPTGYSVVLTAGEGGELLLDVEKPGGEGALSWRLPDLLGRGAVNMDAEGGTLEVLEYWPALEVVDGQPTSRSDRPENPAAVVRLRVPAPRLSGGTTEADLPAMEILTDVDGTSGGHAYRFVRAGEEVSRGMLHPGETIATGWADWTVELVRFEPRAVLGSSWQPADGATIPERSRLPGIRALLKGPGGEARGSAVWMPAGQSVFLGDGEHVVRAAYGHRIRPLSFGITLLNFEVPRDEGTDRPADFRSTVRFDEAETGRSVQAVVRMNHPASFPPGIWGQLSGQTYKFSQAEWNPQNLQETTLQVLHDPGWLLKWIGAVMICFGIGVMFYLTPRRRPREETLSGTGNQKRDPEALDDRTPNTTLQREPEPASSGLH